MDASTKRRARRQRHLRIRRNLRGTATRPRLSVYRSNQHIYAQLIDDIAGHTLVSAASTEDGVAKGEDGKVGVAKQVGALVAERATAQDITTCVFDRGGNRYAGRVAALAEGAREAGLEF